ncbi:T6SS effector BTH_I2691 family protein [Halomonas sp. DN3]|uniref:T6SS effector BTH_I2691 family protein n=1 Tax=Halomonas sp. DN3 TaxID=2953657 RepID=UPI0020A173D9|nr:T6SS effector BTH_I2691 family protein [Halomonas sp. DN3]USZ50865.1 hypothetical protein NKF27_05000 [Halomonas sp. DN3]
MVNPDLLKRIDDACIDLPGVQSGQCPLCERVGLPILPVRLTVCERTSITSGFTELPADRITEFTDIRLNQAVTDQGTSPRTLGEPVRSYLGDTTDSQVSKYILRQLRPGYFYVLDDENTRNTSDGETTGDRVNHNWYAYVVTTDGMFYQFSVSEAPPSPEQPEFACGLNDEERRFKTVSASTIALDSVDTANNIYYLYSEHALPITFLNHLRTATHSDGRRMRDVAMQRFDVAAWRDNKTQQPFAFSAEDLSLVAEYSDNAAGMEAFFWPDQSNRQLFTREELRQAMGQRLRAASQQLKDKSLVLAVHDEVGLINELNKYRQRPLELLEEFLQQYDPQGYLNRRNLLCYKAIEIFEENYRIQRQIAQAPMNQRIEEASQTTIDSKQQRIDQIDRQIEAIRSDGDPNWLDRQRIETLRIERRDLQRQIDAERRSIELLTQEPEQLISAYNKELADYYTLPDAPVDPDTGKPTNPELEDFKAKYKALVERINQLVRAFDEDYSLWVEAHLDRVTVRYSDDIYAPGLGLSGVLSNALLGGILSDASKWLWDGLASAIDSADSLLMKAMFSNQRRLIDDALTVRKALPAKAYVPPRVLLRWREQYREQLKDEREFRYDTIMAAVTTTLGDSLYGLAMQEASRAITTQASDSNSNADTHASDSEGPTDGNNDDNTIELADLPSGDALESFNRYQQLIITGSYDVQQIQASQDPNDTTQYSHLPVLASVTVGRKDFHDWLDTLTRQLYPRANTNSPSPDAMQFHEDNGVGGNFSVTHIENNHQIIVVIPIDTTAPDFLERYNATTDDFDEGDAEKSNWGDRQNARSIAASISDGIRLSNHPSVSGLRNKSFALSKGLVAYNNASVLVREATSDDPDAIQVATALGKLSLVAIDSLDFASTFMASNNAALSSLNRFLQVTKGPIDAALAILSIADGINKQSSAKRAAKLGLPESVQDKYRHSGSIDIADGVVSLVLVGAALVFTGGTAAFVIGAGAIASGVSFSIFKIIMSSSLTVFVARAVAIWVTRCRYGVRDEQGQVLPYDSMEEEQNGLELVFKGVTVEMLIRNPAKDLVEQYGGGIPNERMWEIVSESVRRGTFREVSILVKVPDLDSMEVGLRLELGEGDKKNTILKKNFIKQMDTGMFIERKIGPESGITTEDRNTEISKSGNIYSISSKQEIDARRPGELISLIVSFLDTTKNSGPKTDIFKVRA